MAGLGVPARRSNQVFEIVVVTDRAGPTGKAALCRSGFIPTALPIQLTHFGHLVMAKESTRLTPKLLYGERPPVILTNAGGIIIRTQIRSMMFLALFAGITVAGLAGALNQHAATPLA